MSVGGICNRSSVTAKPDETVAEVARRMTEHDVGTIVVVDDAGRPSGVLTARDVALDCVGRARDPARTRAAQIMSAPVSAPVSASVEDALDRMARARASHLLVVDLQNRLVGTLELDDVLRLVVEEADLIGRVLDRRRSPS